ncbi:MAG: glycosyltransferase [Gemmatimonadota bacterium]
MSVSVIVSTYNQARELELAIWGYANQSLRNFELLIADDGSGPETRRRIDRLRRETGLKIVHVWHEDDGFRKCLILNRALTRATGEYAVISDGDCIPRPDFVETHVRSARPHRFLSGGRVCLARQVTDSLTRADVITGSVFDAGWLRARAGVPRMRDLLKLTTSKPWAAAADRLTTTRATWNGHNASTWRSILLAVNGFNESMSYPTEDRELGERLRNHGIRPVQLRHRAVCVHLDHDRPYADHSLLVRNEAIRRATRGVPRALSRFEGWVPGPSWTEFGIRKEARPADQLVAKARETARQVVSDAG